MYISLKDFLLTGELGVVKLGLHYTEVIKLIGEPDDYGLHKKDTFFKYGNLEFGFYEKILSGIWLYYDKWSVKSSVLNFTDFDPDGTTTLDDFTNWLNDQEIPSQINKHLTFGEQFSLDVGIGVGAYFRDKLLETIQYSGPRTPEKQRPGNELD